MTAYYNEIDGYAAQWLRNLVSAGHIAPGDVDERSIADVRPDDLAGYAQCHFFAGIGGWSHALRLAGWPDHLAVWTGSCPCQPLSSAGQRKGHADARHLWPAFHLLIAERKPSTVFGEQVASKDGREWLAAVRADLEGSGYAVGAADLSAAGAGAPHIRQRLFWVADASSPERRPAAEEWHEPDRADAGRQETASGHRLYRARRLADNAEPGRSEQPKRDAGADGRQTPEPGRLCDAGGMADAGDGPIAERPRAARREDGERAPIGAIGRDDSAGELGDADRAGRLPGLLGGICGIEESAGPRDAESQRRGFWDDLDWLPCADGKWRPTQPGLLPLAHGISGRVAQLRSAGNAIVPQVAAEFIAAYRDCRP